MGDIYKSFPSNGLSLSRVGFSISLLIMQSWKGSSLSPYKEKFHKQLEHMWGHHFLITLLDFLVRLNRMNMHFNCACFSWFGLTPLTQYRSSMAWFHSKSFTWMGRFKEVVLLKFYYGIKRQNIKHCLPNCYLFLTIILSFLLSQEDLDNHSRWNGGINNKKNYERKCKCVGSWESWPRLR